MRKRARSHELLAVPAAQRDRVPSRVKLVYRTPKFRFRSARAPQLLKDPLVFELTRSFAHCVIGLSALGFEIMAKKQTATVPVSPRALVQRIHRKLKSHDEVLKTSRGERARLELGEFYLLDVSVNAIMRKDVDPSELARELDVLKPWEHVTE